MNFQTLIETFQSTASEWANGLLQLAPNLLAAGLVLVMFWLLARVARSLVRRGLTHVLSNQQARSLVSTISYLAVLAGGLMAALNILNLEKTVTSLLAGVGIVGLALGFAFQDLAANFMSGIFMSFRRIFSHGDVIEAAGIMGKVVEVDLRSTWIRTFEGQMICVPNRKLFESPLINYTRSGERRVDITVGVGYDCDLEKAKQAAIEAINEVEPKDEGRDVDVYYKSFGASSIDMSVRFWIRYPEQDFLEAQSRAVTEIKRAFDENGIDIPFPIRTLDLPRTDAQAGSHLKLEMVHANGANES